MNSRAHFRLTIETLAAAALCLAWHAAATAQSYDIRPNCNSSGSCYIRPGTYGYNDTWWRQWPTQYRPEISDPRAIGAGRLPTPPGVPEAKLPASGNLPARPPLSGEGLILPGGILPSGSGSTAPARQPHTETPGDRAPIAPGPDGTLSIPGIPSTPNLFPGEGGTGLTTPAPKELPFLNLGEPGSGPLAPKSGEKEPAKNLDLEKPSAKPRESAPSKPESPSAPGEFHLPQPTAYQAPSLVAAARGSRPTMPSHRPAPRGHRTGNASRTPAWKTTPAAIASSLKPASSSATPVRNGRCITPSKVIAPSSCGKRKSGLRAVRI